MKDPLEDQQTSPAMAGAILVAIVAAALIWSALDPTAFGVTIMVLALLVVVMLHEAGHFLVARRAGMKCTEFFIGFGPRIWSFKRGDTEYGIKAIPAGGYVRIIGMNNLDEVDEDDEPRTFRQAPFRWRLAVAVAGVTVNLALCFVLFFAAFWIQGDPYITTTASNIVADSRAEQSGLREGDRIVALDGEPLATRDWDGLVEYVQARPEEAIVFSVVRDGATRDITVTPEAREEADGDEVGFAGVAPGTAFDDVGPVAAAGDAGKLMWNGTIATVKAFGSFLSPEGIGRQADAVRGNASSDPQVHDRPISVIGIAAFSGELFAESGFWAVVGLVAVVNLALALFNLIPLLPFDGGHVVVACYEKIASTILRRRVQVDFRKLVPVSAAVLILLILLGVSSAYLDIRNLFS